MGTICRSEVTDLFICVAHMLARFQCAFLTYVHFCSYPHPASGVPSSLKCILLPSLKMPRIYSHQRRGPCVGTVFNQVAHSLS